MLFLGVWALAPGKLSYAAADVPRKTLLVGSEVDFPPFALGQRGGEPSGFTVELWKAVAEEAGLDYRIRIAPFHEILEAFKSGEIDVMINLAISEERAAFAGFSLPHVIEQGAVFVREAERGIASEEDLAGKSIIVIESDFFHRQAIARGLHNLVTVSSAAEAMKRLASGRDDGVLIARLVGLQTLRELGLGNVVTAFSLSDPRQKFAFAVRKGEADLLAEINEALANVKASGQYAVLYEKWFGKLKPRRFSTAEIIGWLVPVLIVLALVSVAYLRERRLTRALARSSASLRAMMDNVPYLMWLKGIDGRFVAVNHPFARACGRPDPESVAGKTSFDVWPREIAEAYVSQDTKALECRPVSAARSFAAVSNACTG